MIKSSNILTVVLIVIVLLLMGYIFTSDKPDYIKEYNSKIRVLEAKVDSLHSINHGLVDESDICNSKKYSTRD